MTSKWTVAITPFLESISKSQAAAITKPVGYAFDNTAKSFTGKLTSGIKNFGRVAATGLVSAGAGITAFGAAAVKAQADNEQLIGGVEKLFGPQSAKIVEANAKAAFKTAGLSANDYMESATSFSAALITGLGGDTQKAAKITDIAMRAMSDNVNTFGTDAGSVQNAFQGFAKGNFSMLDNLKLGFGGSQQGMADLINSSGVMGKTFKATAKTVKDVPFDKMILAIQKVQENQHIAGTTAKEAAGTISGSWEASKSAFSNVMVAFSHGPEALKTSLGEFVGIGSSFIKNVAATVGKIAATLIASIPDLVAYVVAQIPSVLSSLQGAVASAIGGLFGKEAASGITSASPVFSSIKNLFVKYLIPSFMEVAGAVKDFVPVVIDGFKKMMPGLKNFVDKVGKALGPAVKNIAGKFKDLIPKVGKLIGILAPAASDFLNFAAPIVATTLGQIGDSIGNIVSVLGGLIDFFTAFPTGLEAIAGGIIAMVAAYKIYTGVISLVKTATDAWKGAQAALDAVLAANPVGLIIAGIVGLVVAIVILWKKSETFRNFVLGMWAVIKGSVTGAFSAIKAAFSIAWNFIKDNWKTILAVFAGPIGLVVKLVVGHWDKIKSGFSNAFGAMKGIFTNFKDGITGGVDALKGAFKAAVDYIKNIWDSTIGALHVPKVVSGALGKAGSILGKVTPFATGGIVTGPTMGLVGEAGPEAIIPLSKMSGLFKDIIVSGGSGGHGGTSFTQVIQTPAPSTRSDYYLTAKRGALAGLTG